MSDRAKLEAEARKWLALELPFKFGESLEDHTDRVAPSLADWAERIQREAVAERDKEWREPAEALMGMDRVSFDAGRAAEREAHEQTRERVRKLQEALRRLHGHEGYISGPVADCDACAALRDEPEEPLCDGSCSAKPDRPHRHGVGSKESKL